MAPDPQQNGSVDKKGHPPPSNDGKKSKKDEKKDEDLVSDEGFSHPVPLVSPLFVFCRPAVSLIRLHYE
jgi:hypothetical protein